MFERKKMRCVRHLRVCVFALYVLVHVHVHFTNGRGHGHVYVYMTCITTCISTYRNLPSKRPLSLLHEVRFSILTY